jgi:glycosyltransferase involved in cell wall biosynthesis
MAQKNLSVMMRMKRVVIVTPYFAPSNLTSGHRARHFASHLAKFGWQVKILSVAPRYYEEIRDEELEKLLPADLEIIRTKALPVRPIRFIGDISIRSFWWHYQKLCDLARKELIDLVYILIPPNYSALLGYLIFRRFGIPYAVDYIDPWVHPWPGCERLFSKAWFAYQLNRKLEPLALRQVSLITGVAPGYYEPVIKRYNWLHSCRFLAVPYGAEEDDFDYLEKYPRPPYLFNPADGNFHIVYAGAMLPRAYPILEALFRAMINLRQNNLRLAQKLKFHFIGTGSSPRDPESFTVRPLAKNYGLLDIVAEHPARIPYLDTLNHLKFASAVLILGSSEAHYTPSKIFQAILSRRPVIAFLRAESTAVDMLRRIGAAETLVTFDLEQPPNSCLEEITGMITRITQENYSSPEFNRDIFNNYSAQTMTKRLAEAFDLVIAKQRE